MVDWEQVERDLDEAGYSNFEFDSGETTVPGLSGSWLAGKIEREGRLERENLPYPWRLLDALPFGSSVPTDPEYAPDAIQRIADGYGLDVVIISVGSDWVRIALVEPN
ncbi:MULTISPECIES: hypothetical protein [Halorussus]|uniref:hypothetical protein n=1 Tax=Halorussus TaxID=1070314 RepID=UPI00209E7927|nr:hypothetical protein [Halorussus vallis]USZ76653.1 hypothetical protein NGM07_04830 [Halorussus vallis]